MPRGQVGQGEPIDGVMWLLARVPAKVPSFIGSLSETRGDEMPGNARRVGALLWERKGTGCCCLGWSHSSESTARNVPKAIGRMDPVRESQ